ATINEPARSPTIRLVSLGKKEPIVAHEEHGGNVAAGLRSEPPEIATTTSGYRLSLTPQMRLATIEHLCCAHRRLLGCCSFRSWVSPSRSDAATARQAATEAHLAANPARRAPP